MSNPTPVDLLQIQALRQCGRWHALMIRFRSIEGTSITIPEIRDYPLPCRSWICPRCGPTRAANLSREISRAIADWDPDLSTFCTFSFSRNDAIYQQFASQLIGPVWNRFMNSLRHHLPKGARWIRVFEYGRKRGKIHVHFLCDQPLQRTYLNRLWNDVSGGGVVYADYVRDLPRVGAYIAKSRIPRMPFNHIPGTRLFGTSRTFWNGRPPGELRRTTRPDAAARILAKYPLDDAPQWLKFSDPTGLICGGRPGETVRVRLSEVSDEWMPLDRLPAHDAPDPARESLDSMKTRQLVNRDPWLKTLETATEEERNANPPVGIEPLQNGGRVVIWRFPDGTHKIVVLPPGAVIEVKTIGPLPPRIET